MEVVSWNQNRIEITNFGKDYTKDEARRRIRNERILRGEYQRKGVKKKRREKEYENIYLLLQELFLCNFTSIHWFFLSTKAYVNCTHLRLFSSTWLISKNRRSRYFSLQLFIAKTTLTVSTKSSVHHYETKLCCASVIRIELRLKPDQNAECWSSLFHS